MNLQEENSALYFWVQSECEQTLVRYLVKKKTYQESQVFVHISGFLQS